MCVRSLLARISAVITYLRFIFLACLFKQTSTKVLTASSGKHYFTHLVCLFALEYMPRGVIYVTCFTGKTKYAYFLVIC
jgi:hypothetical protein